MVVKRVLDVVVAAAALVVLSPVLTVVALLVRLRLGSPVLFRQERAGLDGMSFVLTKLRTMTDAGWAQVNGRNAAGWAERLEMDVWYVENRSLLLDLKILWRTLRVVTAREGVTEDGRATMTEFLGTDE